MSVAILAACSSTQPKDSDALRPRPDHPEPCAETVRRITFRDQFFTSLRGRASVQSLDPKTGAVSDEFEVEVGLETPLSVRAEILGPLGVRLGLFVIDKDWVQLLVLKDRTVHRLPTSEFKKDTLRARRFLERVPFPILPDVFVDGVLTEVGMVDADPVSAKCTYDSVKNLNVVAYSKGANHYRVGVDPASATPLEYEQLDAKSTRSIFSIRYSKLIGEGAATLPRQIEFSFGKEPRLRWIWTKAERWENPPDSAFFWRPAASISVKDY